MNTGLFVDIASSIITKNGQMAAGDSFLTRRDENTGDLVAVLSDGLGSGIKANVLSTLTAKIALDMATAGRSAASSANLIYRSLPTCSVRKISYATFTIIKTLNNGPVEIIEYDNPPARIYREGAELECSREWIRVTKDDGTHTDISRMELVPREGDRIIFFSDGISQAGMGSAVNPLGWKDLNAYISQILRTEPDISSRKLTQLLTRKARLLDGGSARDDISCAVAYYRKPRRVLLASGPPFKDTSDKSLAEKLAGFDGKKIISGGTTAQIVSREWGVPVEMQLSRRPAKLPPWAEMTGADLVTEGILTLASTAEYLEYPERQSRDPHDPAAKIVEMLLESDEIHILGGTRINEAHQDPAMPVELEIRRNILKRLSGILKDQYVKETYLEYI